MQQYPALDPYDPGDRRLRYLRYADAFLLGFAGPRAEAEAIKAQLTEFLKSKLHLTLAGEKTLITSAINSRARFLGYEIGVWKVDTKRDARQERSINGGIGLYVPEDVIQRKRKRYLRDGKTARWYTDPNSGTIANTISSPNIKESIEVSCITTAWPTI